MKLSRRQLRKLILESTEELPAASSKEDYTPKLKIMLASDPSIENIRHVFELANTSVEDANVIIDMKQLHKAAFDAIMTMVKNANVLEHVRVDNVVHEIDDILYRVRDIGLQAMNIGIESVDKMEDMGQLSEDQVYETGMELVNSVKIDAMDAIERSMAQVILETLK